MLRSNPYRPDPRVARAAHALVRAGYRVTLICWDRRAELPARERAAGIEIMRVHRVRSGYAVGWRQLRHVPVFWREAVRMALPLAPHIVHCHDLDTLPAGWVLKRRLGCALVYDAHEHYPAVLSLYLPRVLVRALALIENLLLPRVDAAITASTVLGEEFRRRGVEPVVAVGNYADLGRFEGLGDVEVESARADLGVSAARLLVGYIGGFTRDRLLRPFLDAADLLPDVQFHLWGDGPQRWVVEEAAAARANVRYHGWLPDAAVPLHFRALDVVYYGLRTDYVGAPYAAPNALGLAMAAGRPIVASAIGDLARVVAATQCGLLLEDSTPEAIAAAVRRLVVAAERQRLGANGLRAARERYNAEAAQRPHVELYRTLCPPGLVRATA